MRVRMSHLVRHRIWRLGLVTDELLDKLEAAYQAWHDCKGADPEVWYAWRVE